MARKRPSTEPVEPRKTRTREHVICDQSVLYVQSLIIRAGHVSELRTHDYGFDMTMYTFDEHGHQEPGEVYFQLKATDRITRYELKDKSNFSFPIDIRDSYAWRDEPSPAFLILYDTVLDEAYWLDLGEYLRSIAKPKAGTKTVHLRIPIIQVLGIRTIEHMRQRKARLMERRRMERHDG